MNFDESRTVELDIEDNIGKEMNRDARAIFDKIDNTENRVMPIAQVNELIRDLSYLPYKVVAPFMTVINNKENFLRYFVPIEHKKQ